MEQPRWDDEVSAWRGFALIERERADAWRSWFKASRTAQRRANRLLDRLDGLLRDGDAAAASELLAQRRAWIERAERDREGL